MTISAFNREVYSNDPPQDREVLNKNIYGATTELNEHLTICKKYEEVIISEEKYLELGIPYVEM